MTRILLWGVMWSTLLMVGQAGDSKVRNGTFSDGLNHWTVAGDVSDFSGQALFWDLEAQSSSLHQGVQFIGEQVRVDFQFLNLLSANRPAGTLLDTVSASLYFVDDPDGFDFSPASYLSSTKLFDIDSGGVFNTMGSIEPSTAQPGWTAFSATVPATNACVIFAVEFFNQNGVLGDSRFFADWLNLSRPGSVCSPLSLRIADGEVELTFAPIQGFSNVVETTEDLEDETSWVPTDLPLADLETYREPLGPVRKFYRVLFNRND